ncbi:hypothetical protein L195_g061563, partial [Trifolium pratense]
PLYVGRELRNLSTIAADGYSLISGEYDVVLCCIAIGLSYQKHDRTHGGCNMICHREKNGNQTRRLICFDCTCSAAIFCSLYLPFEALSDVDNSPQSTPHYLLTLPPYMPCFR